MTTTGTSPESKPRQRVPASERRDALIEAAVHEFAHGGLYGTPVARIAQRVGVAQPYVFSLFPTKRDLFLAAIERGFELVEETFTRAAEEFDPATAPPDTDLRQAMGRAYTELLHSHRDFLMLQHQGYAACNDPVIRERVRQLFARLVAHVEGLWDARPEEIDDFVRYGMWCNVAAAMGVEDLSASSEWMRAQLAESDQSGGHASS